MQIARNEKASDHLQFLNAILRDFKNIILLKSRGQTPEDLRFRSKSHFLKCEIAGPNPPEEEEEKTKGG
jgi:hypothetical protein